MNETTYKFEITQVIQNEPVIEFQPIEFKNATEFFGAVAEYWENWTNIADEPTFAIWDNEVRFESNDPFTYEIWSRVY